jgi:hypothetical protein
MVGRGCSEVPRGGSVGADLDSLMDGAGVKASVRREETLAAADQT